MEAVVVHDEVSDISNWISFSTEDAAVLCLVVILLRTSLKKYRFPIFQSESGTATKSVSVFDDMKLDRCFSTVFRKLQENIAHLQEKDTRWMLTTGSLSFVNAWDIGVNKGVFEMISRIAPECRNLIVLDHFSLTHDVDTLDEIPDLTLPRYGGRYNDISDIDHLMKPRTKFEYLCYPLFIAPEKEESCLLVGTYARSGTDEKSKLHDESMVEERSKKVLQRVKIQVTSHGRPNILVPRVVPVQYQRKEDISKLQETLEEVFTRNNRYQSEIPLKWAFLRTYLASTKALYITLPDLRAIAKKIHIMDVEEVNELLKYFASGGSIIHIKSLCPECADEYVILRPAEFVDEVQKLYDIGEYEIDEALKSRHKKGYVSTKLADALWAKLPRADCPHSFFIHALRRLDIIARLKTRREDMRKEESDQEFFMPLIRSKCERNEDESSLFITHNAMFPFPLQSQFLMFFQHVLEDIVLFSPTDCFNTLRFENVMEKPSKYFDVYFMHRYIEICGKGLSKSFRSTIKTACIEVMAGIQRNSPKMNLEYDLAIQCPLKPGKKHFILFHPLQNSSELFCGECQSVVHLTDQRLEWIQADYTGPRRLVRSPEGKFDIQRAVG